jgi:hypothetical protein
MALLSWPDKILVLKSHFLLSKGLTHSIHACVNLYEPMLLMYLYAYYLSMCMLIMLLPILLLMDDAWKKEKLHFMLKLA